MAVAASVASAPVTHNAITMVVASGAAEPVTAVHSDPSPPMDDGPSGVLWGYVWAADGTESYGVLPW